MADFNIQPIGAQIKPVQGISLGDMVNLARGAQAYQQSLQTNPLELQRLQQETRTGQIALSVEEQKDKERRNIMTLLSDPSKYTKNNRLDLDVLTPKIMEIAPLTAPTFIQGLTTLANAQTTADAAASELNQADRALLAQPLAVAGYQGVTDPNVYAKIIKETQELNKNNPRLVALGDSYLTQLQFADPNKLPDIAIRASQNLLKPSETKAMAPQAGTLSTGEQIFPTVTTPAVGGMQPRIQMGAQPLADVGIPPTTEVVNPATGERRLIGPASQRQQQPMVTSVGPAQAGGLEAQAAVIKEDLPRTIAEAKDAPARIGIFQNIKKLAPEAFTGPTAERRQAVASFAQMLGMPAYQLETASTDELMKNTKLLQLAGGNTDAARALAEFANPNNKMTKEGIARVTDQLIGIEKMREARAKYLTPYQNNTAEYLQRKQDFDSISDPRLFQEMSREDAVKMWKSMSPAQQAEILDMQRKAKNLGVIK